MQKNIGILILYQLSILTYVVPLFPLFYGLLYILNILLSKYNCIECKYTLRQIVNTKFIFYYCYYSFKINMNLLYATPSKCLVSITILKGFTKI